MTDKAQIIIDSVDVSKCEHYNICKQCELSQLPESFYKLRCSENLDCNFKQLARKTAECEKYEQALEEVYGIIVGLLVMKDVKHLSKETNEILNIISKVKDGIEWQ